MESNMIHIDIEKQMLTAHGKTNLTVQTTIRPGELVALFGHSGAGKTTLLRIISGLAAPDKGIVRFGSTTWFDSKRKIDLPPQQRNIGFMFQDYALFPNMTVEDNILFAQNRKDREAAGKLIGIFGLAEFRKQKPGRLSGGQKQRVALARVLARKPGLLLLDEPLSALDAKMRVMLQEEIKKAHRLSGGTTIMVSHDPNEVLRLASTMICIENGNIMQEGKPEKIFSGGTKKDLCFIC